MAARARIMVVDDEADVRATVVDCLTPVGYDLVEAASAREALTLMGQQPADVIILDVAMPELDGLHALRTLRALNPTAPVIMLTATADVELARDTLRMGAFDYIAKPFTLKHLRDVVAAAVTQAR